MAQIIKVVLESGMYYLVSNETFSFSFQIFLSDSIKGPSNMALATIMDLKLLCSRNNADF